MFLSASPIELIILAVVSWQLTKGIYFWQGIKPTLGDSRSQPPHAEANSFNAGIGDETQAVKTETPKTGFPWTLLICLGIGMAILGTRSPGMSMNEFQFLTVIGAGGFLFLILLRYLWPTALPRLPGTIAAGISEGSIEADATPPTFFALLNSWMNELLRWSYEFLRSLPVETRDLIKRAIGPSLWIGWYFAGAFDILLTLFFSFNPQFPVYIVAMWLIMSAISFVAAHCIYVRQNLTLLRRMSYLGLLPLSFGAIIRIPLSFFTLLWQMSRDTRESFGTTPWAETQLGRLMNAYVGPLFQK